MGTKKKHIAKKSSANRLYKELSKSGRRKSKSSMDLSKSLDHELEKTLSLDLEIIFQRRMREDSFC